MRAERRVFSMVFSVVTLAVVACGTVALSGCSALHDWDTVDGGGEDALAPDASCVDMCGGECADLANDVAHCGACEIDCTALANVLMDAAGIRCSAGRCVIPPSACRPGFADCVGSNDGCETDLSSPSSCGSCANECAVPTPLCDATTGTCTDRCGDGLTICALSCVDLTSDSSNCGRCDLSCSAVPGSTPTCEQSVCAYECLIGYHDCSVACQPNTSPRSCGTSCSPCPEHANAEETCPAGACVTVCLPGFHDCAGVCVADDDSLNCGVACKSCPAPPGADAACAAGECGVDCPPNRHLCGDACLADSDMGSCGGSCIPCPVPPNARATCDGVSCGTVCRDTHADCDGRGDGSDANGCEADLSDPAHCGTCAVACTALVEVCGMSAGSFRCASGCSGGQSLCGGTCANLQLSLQHCGVCDRACPAPANGEASCAAGNCGVVCDSGFHACGASCVANTSTNGCGTSCSACSAPVQASATCDGVACSWQCNPGYHMCSGACADDRAVVSCGSACSPCPSPANGSATCDGTACGFVCNLGFHACGGACAANTSTGSCGASCGACPAPANATSTCDGTSCDFVCRVGFHRCGDACVSDTATATCGASCTACAPPPNAAATCDGNSCDFSCNAGFHRCGGVCLSNTSLASCGSSCTPCAAPANAFATCGGTACGFTCATGFADCDGIASNGCEANLAAPATCGSCTRACSGGTAVCSGGACSSGCDAAMPTRCGMSCVDTTSNPLYCGDCSTVCAPPPSSSATCSSGSCSFACNPGFHACGGVCAGNDSPATCGSRCAPCAAPPGATATCSAGACDFVCNVGFNRCGSACVAANSVTQCGTACTLCVPPPSGVPVCSGGGCDFTCITGTHRCGDACASNASTGSCGASCLPCVPPANAGATCGGTSCDFVCDAGYVRLGAACVAIAPPRALFPLSMSHITSLSPQLRWTLAPGTTGARVEICGDRACSTIARTVDITGTSTTLAPLTSGLWFWRLTGRVGTNTGTTTSAPFEMTLARRSSPRATAWGAMIDASGDGFADALVGAPAAAAAYTHRGSVTGVSSTASRTLTGPVSFGRSASAAGDLDGDGFGDVVVGAPEAASATVFYGSPTGLGGRTPLTIAGPVATFGAAVAAAGDVDGDGYGDLIVGADGPGRVYVFRGAATGVGAVAAWVIVGAGAGFGAAVASAGDVNSDGFADLAVGDPGNAQVLVYHGAAAGLGATPLAATTLSGAATFGATVACAGDVNGDGFTDVVVGEPGARRAYVFSGSASIGLGTTGGMLRVPGSGQFGQAVAAAGDVDGDGYDDVLVGSEAARRAWIFGGAAAGIGTTARTTFAPPASDTTSFGATLASGDYDRDGFSDVLVGSPAAASVYCYIGALGVGPSTSAAVVLFGPVGSAFGRALALLDYGTRPLGLLAAPLSAAKKS